MPNTTTISHTNIYFLEKMTKANNFLLNDKRDAYRLWLYIPIIALIGGVLGAIFSALNLLIIGSVHGLKKAIDSCKSGFYKKESLDKNKTLIKNNTDYLLGYLLMGAAGGTGGAFIFGLVMICKDKTSNTSSLE